MSVYTKCRFRRHVGTENDVSELDILGRFRPFTPIIDSLKKTRDGRTDGRTDGWTDRQRLSYRNPLLEMRDASRKNASQLSYETNVLVFNLYEILIKWTEEKAEFYIYILQSAVLMTMISWISARIGGYHWIFGKNNNGGLGCCFCGRHHPTLWFGERTHLYHGR